VALFFDKTWFDARLRSLGLDRIALAQAAGVPISDLDLMFKDQMEVSAGQVQAWAAILGETTAQIALRCGVSTPQTAAVTDGERIDALERRVMSLEAQIRALTTQPSAKSDAS
jgi:hypothetical protein